MTSSQPDLRDELIQRMRETAVECETYLEDLRHTQENVQYIADLAYAGERVVRYLQGSGSGMQWEPAVEMWTLIKERLIGSRSAADRAPDRYFSASGSSAAFVMTTFTQQRLVDNNVAADEQNDARVELMKLATVIDRFADREKAVELMKHFDLKDARGKKGAIELFETAWAACNRPVANGSPVITSLIPMRECINKVVAELLRRRPRQQPAPSQAKKVESIGGQLGRDGIASTAIQSLADRWHTLNDELSSAKEADLSREEWRISLQKATLFLIELLESLDPGKLR